MNILITGGLGYIGSHMVRMASVNPDYTVTVLDTNENGHFQAVPKETEVVIGNVANEEVLSKIFEKKKIDAVVHFAGYLRVEESVQDPIKYMKNNLIGPLTMLQVMHKYEVKYCVFSSSAAIYGHPKTVPIHEDHEKNPESPYGLSKWCFEQLLGIADRTQDLRSISLRYFNAAGASLDGLHGEAHNIETHIIPRALEVALGKQPAFSLYGTDYKTRDGSCERDYIHIEDLCTAHFFALDALFNGHKTDSYNVATGFGVTNKELVDAVKKVSGQSFAVENKDRRPGDPDVLVADSQKIQTEFGWKPEHSSLDSIISSAWKWHTSHPNGYES